jgi:hypothetical protein
MSERVDDDLLERLQGLSREEVLEAARAVAEQLKVGDASGEEAESFLAEVEEEPFAALEDVEQLARAALIAAALSPDGANVVREAVGATGQKAIVFGGAEIIAVGAVAVALLQTFQAKGRTSEEETLEVGHDEAGRPYLKHSRKTTYGLSARLGRLLSSVLRNS